MRSSGRVSGRSRVDLYLPRHLVEEALTVLRPTPAPAKPHRSVGPTRVAAETLVGGCQLYRLPRTGR